MEGGRLLEVIRGIHAIYLIPQFVLALCFGLVNASLNNEILKEFNIRLRAKEWIGLGFTNTLFNYLFPFKTGTMVKALYLRNKYNFKISHNASILVFTHFVFFDS